MQSRLEVEVLQQLEAPLRHFHCYPEYVDTGVEWLREIPLGWKVGRLRYATKLNPSSREICHLTADTLVSFIPMDSIGERGGLRLDQIKTLGEMAPGYSYFKTGDVVVAKITPCFENGKGALADRLKNNIAFGTTELHVLRPLRQLDARFLFYLTISRSFRKIGASTMYGAGGQQRVADDFMRNFVHPVPPEAEQLFIAAFLDRETSRIDSLIAKKERLIELLHEKRTAIITWAVTKGLASSVPMKDSGSKWIGEIPAHWETAELRRLSAAGTSITYGIVQAGPEVPGGVPYIKTSDMSGDFLPQNGYSRTSPEIAASYQRSRVSTGDIVIAIRATVGKALQVPAYLDGANLTQGTAKFSPGPGVSSEFLLRALQSTNTQARFAALAKGATFREITLDMLRRLSIALPPLAEQQEIVKYLSPRLRGLDEAVAQIRNAIDRITEYRTALISAAVTGKIDVRGEVA